MGPWDDEVRSSPAGGAAPLPRLARLPGRGRPRSPAGESTGPGLSRLWGWSRGRRISRRRGAWGPVEDAGRAPNGPPIPGVASSYRPLTETSTRIKSVRGGLSIANNGRSILGMCPEAACVTHGAWVPAEIEDAETIDCHRHTGMTTKHRTVHSTITAGPSSPSIGFVHHQADAGNARLAATAYEVRACAHSYLPPSHSR